MKMTNIFKPHIVRFKDGKYAVRKYSLFYFCYIYKDVLGMGDNYWWDVKDNYWWGVKDSWFHHCKCTLEEATKTMANIPTIKKRVEHIDKGDIV